jgi:hypothetical protein
MTPAFGPESFFDLLRCSVVIHIVPASKNAERFTVIFGAEQVFNKASRWKPLKKFNA